MTTRVIGMKQMMHPDVLAMEINGKEVRVLQTITAVIALARDLRRLLRIFRQLLQFQRLLLQISKTTTNAIVKKKPKNIVVRTKLTKVKLGI